MKNYEVLALINSGIMQATAYELGPESAYKVYKFKKLIQKAFERLQEDERDLLKNAGIEDGAAFDTRRTELAKIENPTEEEKKELEEMGEKLKKYISLRETLYTDDVDVSSIKPISYEEWFKLKKENKAVKINDRETDIFGGAIEGLLEGVFWTTPEE